MTLEKRADAIFHLPTSFGKPPIEQFQHLPNIFGKQKMGKELKEGNNLKYVVGFFPIYFPNR